jgi:hypothetical protein
MDKMSENIATLMYETNLRARLFRTSNGAGKHVVALTQLERLLVELIGMRDNMSIFFNHKLGFQLERAESVYPHRAKIDIKVHHDLLSTNRWCAV